MRTRKTGRNRPNRQVNPETQRLLGDNLDPAVEDAVRRIYKDIIRDEYGDARDLIEADRANVRQRTTDRMNSSGYRVTLKQVEAATARLRMHDPREKDRPVELPRGIHASLAEEAVARGWSMKGLAAHLIATGLSLLDQSDRQGIMP